MKAPDEIKKALVEAIAETFWASNDGDVQDLQVTCDLAHAAMGDALMYIRGLEDKVEELNRIRADLTATNMQLRDAVFKNELFKRRLEEERSAFEAQVPRWISVEERLPDKMKHVLVFKQRNEHALWPVAMWHIETDWRGNDGWSKNIDNGYFDITHWMPLPEPPKEDD